MRRSFSRARLLLRSFLIQGSWNYRTLLGSGFAWALGPTSESPKDPARDSTERERGEGEREAVAREAKPFNTHPYLSPIALGALARIRDDGVDAARAKTFRQALRSPLGGLGDGLVWGAWRPTCLLAAGALALLDATPAVVLASFLVTYNALHVGLRIRGIRVGSQPLADVAAGIRDMHIPDWTERIRAVGVLFLGLALGLLVSRGAIGPELGPAWIAGGLTLFLAGFSGGDSLRRWGPELLLLLVLVGSWFAGS